MILYGISRWTSTRETQGNQVLPAETPTPETPRCAHSLKDHVPTPRTSFLHHFRSTVIRFRVRLSRLLFETAGGAALSAFPAPGEPELWCHRRSAALSRTAPEEETQGRPPWGRASGLRCCPWQAGAGAATERDPPPRPPCPPCRGRRKMPVKKKRKAPGVAAAVAEDSGLKKCKISSYCRSQPPARLISGEEDFSRKKCLAWFYEYAGPDEVVGPEGMEKFCEDIGVEPENIIMLVLAWKLEAESMGFFTKEEWLKGMTSLQCDCTEKLQSRFDFLRSQLNDISSFKNIYRYAFDFARDKDQRSLDIDTAKSMLALLLGRTWPLFSVFYQYLEQSKYRVMNKDQWYNVLEFSRTVHADLSNYDEDGAYDLSFSAVDLIMIHTGEEDKQ
ncbi:hypothetical protein STEG23_006765 [Scotinomys teguina]